MKRDGKPISNDERRGRSIKQLIHYGLKMGTRSHGGVADDKLAAMYANKLRGMTATEAGELVAEWVVGAEGHVASRQRRAIEELQRRVDALMLARELAESYGVLARAVATFLDGTSVPGDGVIDDDVPGDESVLEG